MRPEDIGGVHIKYLHHCRRQLWLYACGVRPEQLNAAVQLGEAVHDVSYRRNSPVDLGAAVLDFVDGEQWVHEVKSSSRSTTADEAQVVHYCYRLRQVGVPARGAVLHYPKTRRTKKIEYDDAEADRAERDIADALAVTAAPESPPRLARTRCRGCSFVDYCWSD
ncbi:CRISPR-associated protein Cas4 [Solwaraspora sp. WMMD792]|uniref:CRISPR-associated protein Cas4 n=1 Tax=Solwaraspora sp. WMMD792 TaxID=3016099 RepID=UPI002415B041|nr:CRISPR-associated protein Cas4 [Solwaraspora sp. WMMD792]MDG4773590.1 CRISPR-associated protein Cas4 [Solwaraspora sp. WMMD792]